MRACICIKYEHLMHMYMWFVKCLLDFRVTNIGTFDRYNIDVYSIRELPTSDLWLPRSVTVRDLVVYITRIVCVVPILTDMFWGIKRKNSVSETIKV